MKHLVFVYGTLKSGHGNHGVLANSKGAEFIADVKTKPEYHMVSLGGFPGVIAGGTTAITGEVWAVDDLTSMDRLEGHPSFYKRTEIVIDGIEDVVNIYLLDDSYLDCTPVEDGVWH